MKAQGVRLADVFIIGPLMVWGGIAAGRQNSLAGTALALLGVGTIAYNARNYQRVRKGLGP
jgi:hypothetical protein